jgi:hypothetical protein
MIAGDAIVDVCAPADPRRFPSAEDLRMVRAIALLALLEAVRHGEYRATFRGFRVEAIRRHGLGRAAPTVEVHLVVTLSGKVVERCALDVDEMRWSSSKTECDRTHVVDDETFVDCNGH